MHHRKAVQILKLGHDGHLRLDRLHGQLDLVVALPPGRRLIVQVAQPAGALGQMDEIARQRFVLALGDGAHQRRRDDVDECSETGRWNYIVLLY